MTTKQSNDNSPSLKNRAVFDGWTLAHIATGMVAKRIGLSAPVYMGLAVAFEVAEHMVERRFKRPETPKNVAGDLLAGILGYAIARDP